MTISRIGAVLLLVVVAGCSLLPGGGSPALAGRDFLSTSVTVAGLDQPLVAGTQIRLSFSEDGMLGAMAGWTGTFAALQAIRVLLADVAALGEPAWGQVFLLDGLAPSLRSFAIAKDPACSACAR